MLQFYAEAIGRGPSAAPLSGTKNIQDVYGLKASVGSPAREERRVRVSTWRNDIFKRLDGPSMGT